MMSQLFRRRSHEMPALNTSSLPDLIFTVLFFFMIVTHMRDVELRVRYEVPQGTELQKLTHKSAVSYIYVGLDNTVARRSSESGADGEMLIQLNDKIATPNDIKAYLEQERSRMSTEDQARMTVSIKADRETPMGQIADIKHMLQQSFALKINYSATEK